MSHPATVEFASASRAGRWSARISHDGPVLALAFSPDGTRHQGNARGGQPLTEAVMIGISGTQGFSFVSPGAWYLGEKTTAAGNLRARGPRLGRMASLFGRTEALGAETDNALS